MELYQHIWRLRRDAAPEKGLGYSFVLNRALGTNGNIKDHKWSGRVIRKAGENYKIVSVNVHWYRGYYYWIVANDSNGSSMCIALNINCNECPFDYWADADPEADMDLSDLENEREMIYTPSV